ncbi:MAG: hypothetical protein IH865_13425 [Chloroflexi bacterium]|nr:hypothetical protein [Chloroflexota bacterium]
MPDDKIKREIEDILNKLDDFVPDESAAEKMRRRSSGAAASVVRAILAPFTRISIRQVMLTALVVIVVGFLAMRVNPIFGRYALIAGVILFVTSFALSFFSRSGGTTPPAVEQRWRGQPIDLNRPSLPDRIKAWLKSRRRPHY